MEQLKRGRASSIAARISVEHRTSRSYKDDRTRDHVDVFSVESRGREKTYKGFKYFSQGHDQESCGTHLSLLDWYFVSHLTLNNREKSLRHVAMVANFWDEQPKPKIHLIRTVSKFIDVIQLHLICQMFAKFSGFNPKGPYQSFTKRKRNLFVVFTNSVQRAREIRKFHFAVVHQQLRNIQKRLTHVQSCCFANLNLSGFFCRSRYCRRRRCLISALLLSSRNLATMVTWRHTSPLY